MYSRLNMTRMGLPFSLQKVATWENPGEYAVSIKGGLHTGFEEFGRNSIVNESSSVEPLM